MRLTSAALKETEYFDYVYLTDIRKHVNTTHVNYAPTELINELRVSNQILRNSEPYYAVNNNMFVMDMLMKGTIVDSGFFVNFVLKLTAMKRYQEAFDIMEKYWNMEYQKEFETTFPTHYQTMIRYSYFNDIIKLYNKLEELGCRFTSDEMGVGSMEEVYYGFIIELYNNFGANDLSSLRDLSKEYFNLDKLNCLTAKTIEHVSSMYHLFSNFICDLKMLYRKGKPKRKFHKEILMIEEIRQHLQIMFKMAEPFDLENPRTVKIIQNFTYEYLTEGRTPDERISKFLSVDNSWSGYMKKWYNWLIGI